MLRSECGEAKSSTPIFWGVRDVGESIDAWIYHRRCLERRCHETQKLQESDFQRRSRRRCYLIFQVSVNTRPESYSHNPGLFHWSSKRNGGVGRTTRPLGKGFCSLEAATGPNCRFTFAHGISAFYPAGADVAADVETRFSRAIFLRLTERFLHPQRVHLSSPRRRQSPFSCTPLHSEHRRNGCNSSSFLNRLCQA